MVLLETAVDQYDRSAGAFEAEGRGSCIKAVELTEMTKVKSELKLKMIEIISFRHFRHFNLSAIF